MNQFRFNQHKAGFLLIVLLIITFRLQAQPPLYHFPQPGMQQVEIYSQDWTQQFQPRNNSFYYLNDTVIGPYTFSRIVPPGYNNNSTLLNFYYDSGKIYLVGLTNFTNPSQGTLLYDFSLNVGDTFVCNNGGFVIIGPYVVDSVGAILLPNGQTRKYMELVQGTNRLKWIDAIGDIEHGFYYLSDFEGGYEIFVCQSDSSGNVYGAPNSPYYCSMTNPIPGPGLNTCSGFSYTTFITPPNCMSCTGVLQINNMSGGVAPYSYQWSNTQSGNTISGLCSGNYTVTITDSTGSVCSQAYNMSSSLPSITFAIPDSNLCDYTDTLCAIVTGGVPPYVYAWNPSGYFGNCFPASFPATYTVQVTDSYGCSAYQTINANPGTPLLVNEPLINPSCANCCDGNIVLQPSGGYPPYSITYPNGSWPAPGNFCTGSYNYCVTDSMGCSTCDSVVLSFTTAIADFSADTSFLVFPNPASGEVTISGAGFSDTPLHFFDVRGQRIMTVLLTADKPVLDVSHWPSGVYVAVLGEQRIKLIVLH